MIAVRIRFGHLDRMPRCVVTRLAVPFCSHCERNLNPTQGVSDHHDRTSSPAVLVPFHNEGVAHDEANNRQENESVFRF